MISRQLFSVALLICLSLGIAHEAYAVGPCSAVCAGPNEPCSLRCYLPGPFVTTCGELAGNQCIQFRATTLENSSEDASCDLDVAAMSVTPDRNELADDNSADLIARIAAWMRSEIALVGDIVSRFRLFAA